MAVTITKTVKPLGGGDYVSLAAAIAAEKVIRPNLVANDEILQLECYGGTDLGGQAIIDTFTVDATRYIRVYSPAGQKHLGVWNADKYNLDVTNNNGIVINRNFVRIEGLQIRVSTSIAVSAIVMGTGMSAGAYDIRVDKCYMRGVGNGSSGFDGFINSSAVDDVNGIIKLSNNIAEGFHDGSNTCTGFNFRSGKVNEKVFAYNNTAIRCQTGFRGRSYTRLKNNVAIDCFSAFASTEAAHAASTNNAATRKVSASVGSNLFAPVSVLMIDPLNGDYRLHTGDTNLKGQGVNLSADPDLPVTTDIADAARTAPFCIGAFEQDAAATQDVRWCWSGGVTPTTAQVKVRLVLAEATEAVSLLVSLTPNLANPTTFGPKNALASKNNVATFDLTGLTANTQYYYGVKIGATTYGKQGKFRTFPSGAASFAFATSGDVNTGLADPVFDEITSQNPLLFMHLGDAHYDDHLLNNLQTYRDSYDRFLHATPQTRMWLSMPVDYVWDDHDWASDNSDRTSPGGPAAMDAYRENAAHYELPAGDPGQFPIYHSFVVGRCRFIVSDLRSKRDPNSYPDGPAKTMMGTVQKTWFKNEVLAAKAAGQAIVWVCSVPWIDVSTPGVRDPDAWGAYADERKELSDFFQANKIKALVRLCADAHMIALDDGTNDKYTTDGTGNGFVTFHAAPLMQTGTVKGGPYSHGTFIGVEAEASGQYGLVTVTDTGGSTISIKFSGRRYQTELVSFTKVLSVPPVAVPAPPTIISNLEPTTELEAVNSMLSAIGEAPVDSLTSAQGDVAIALNILRDVTREMETMGWRFNTEFGYEVAPIDQLDWTDTTGKITTLNIFKPEAHLIRLNKTITSEQDTLDIVVRPSRRYQQAGSSVLVFYDRSLNRDGFDAALFPYLYINPVWAFDFEQMPEEARRFCVIRASRIFVERVVGSDTLARFTDKDEQLAYRNLKREWGEDDDYNMLKSASVLRHFGRRPVTAQGRLFDPRKSPGSI